MSELIKKLKKNVIVKEKFKDLQRLYSGESSEKLF